MVQTNRAVCWVVDSRTPPQSTPCPVSQVAVRGEVLADRPDQQRAEPEHAEAERDVGGYPAAADLQRVHEEGQRDPVHLLGDELLDKTSGEGHQVIGRDGPGDGYAHCRTLGDARYCRKQRGREVTLPAVAVSSADVLDLYHR